MKQLKNVMYLVVGAIVIALVTGVVHAAESKATAKTIDVTAPKKAVPTPVKKPVPVVKKKEVKEEPKRVHKKLPTLKKKYEVQETK